MPLSLCSAILYTYKSFALKTALSETSAATYFQVCKCLGFFSVAEIRCHDKSNLGRERVYYNSQFKAGLSIISREVTELKLQVANLLQPHQKNTKDTRMPVLSSLSYTVQNPLPGE